MNKNVVGIYQIKNLINGKIYIGSSIDIRGRWWNHKSMLKRGIHDNAHLQRAWDKYGSKIFKFSILEKIVNIENLLVREQWYLDNWSPEYNIAECAVSPRRGTTITEETRRKILAYWTKEKREEISKVNKGNTNFRGKRHSEESRKKISKANLGRVFSSETRNRMRQANLGKILSDEHKEKIRKSNSGENGSGSKLTLDDVKEIRDLYSTGKHSYREIGGMYSITGTNVYYIVKNKTWKI